MKVRDIIAEREDPDKLHADLAAAGLLDPDREKWGDFDRTGLWNMDIYLPADIEAKLQKAFPQGPEPLELLLTGGQSLYETKRLRMECQPGAKSMTFAANNFGAIDLMERRWYFHEDRLELEKIHLFEESRGQRIGRRILAGTYEAGRRLGVKRMTMSAAFQGAFLWAKAGFLPKKGNYDWHQMQRKLDRSAAGQQNNKAVQAAAALFDYGDPYCIWRIADHPGGWDLLTGDTVKSGINMIRWPGVFEMGNAAQEARLHEFCGAEMAWIRSLAK